MGSHWLFSPAAKDAVALLPQALGAQLIPLIRNLRQFLWSPAFGNHGQLLWALGFRNHGQLQYSLAFGNHGQLLPFLLRCKSCLTLRPHGLQHTGPSVLYISQSLLKLKSIESEMPSNHLIRCCPLSPTAPVVAGYVCRCLGHLRTVWEL